VADARWLTNDEERAWRAFLRGTRLLLDQLDRELLQQAGIPHAYYGIMVVLSEQPYRALRMSEIAERLCFSKSRLTHAIGRLAERGWVERIACRTDRRGQFAVLTEAGQEALSAAAPTHVAGIRRHLFDRLTPEQVEQLRAIGEAISKPLMSEETSAACAPQLPEDSAPHPCPHHAYHGAARHPRTT
jgi:DNA-binding MarR family transcriptional regulator